MCASGTWGEAGNRMLCELWVGGRRVGAARAHGAFSNLCTPPSKLYPCARYVQTASEPADMP